MPCCNSTILLSYMLLCFVSIILIVTSSLESTYVFNMSDNLGYLNTVGEDHRVSGLKSLQIQDLYSWFVSTIHYQLHPAIYGHPSSQHFASSSSKYSSLFPNLFLGLLTELWKDDGFPLTGTEITCAIIIIFISVSRISEDPNTKHSYYGWPLVILWILNILIVINYGF